MMAVVRARAVLNNDDGESLHVAIRYMRLLLPSREASETVIRRRQEEASHYPVLVSVCVVHACGRP